MRELHSRDGDRPPAPDAGADNPVTRAREAPKHEVLRDSEARIAEHLKYRKTVEAAQARYAAEQQPERAKPGRERPETPDGFRAEIDERWESAGSQESKLRKPERSRLPSNETAQLVVGFSVVASSVAEAVNTTSGRWDAVATSAIGAAAAGIAWGNKRWKDKHGNRPED